MIKIQVLEIFQMGVNRVIAGRVDGKLPFIQESRMAWIDGVLDQAVEIQTEMMPRITDPELRHIRSFVIKSDIVFGAGTVLVIQ